MQVLDYNCPLRSESTAANGQNKNDIGLLVACKVQLSSEVIRWKTESLRLQKERDSAHLRSKELDQTVSKLAEQVKDLESRLALADEENKKFKVRNNDATEEMSNSIQRLSQSLNKYHSFPTVDCNKSLKPKFSGRLDNLDPQMHQDWREVSKNLMKQMQEEMKELQYMNSCLESKHPESSREEVPFDLSCKETLEGCLSNLVSDTKSLKLQLLDQRKKLQSLLRNISQETFIQKDSVPARKEISHSLNAGIFNSSTTPIQGSSGKTFCDNLVDQLRGLPELHKEQEVWNVEDDLTLHPTYSSPEEAYQDNKEQQKSEDVVDDRICPICQKIFGKSVPQSEFEEHVFNHLEAESESLLDNFVVL